jgi:hypothetical protein
MLNTSSKNEEHKHSQHHQQLNPQLVPEQSRTKLIFSEIVLTTKNYLRFITDVSNV